MTYQADDNEIYVPVTDERSGQPISATDFLEAVYQISTTRGVVLFTATLLDNISVVNGEFKIRYPRDMSQAVGDQRHEMRVKDVQGNESTILQTTIKNVSTRIRI